MFCSNCGERASGNFCAACGQRLAQAGGGVGSSLASPAETSGNAQLPWQELTDYEALLRVPEVRERIALHAARAQKRPTGEECLEVCDKIFSPLTGGVPLTFISNLTQPISTRLGLKTGKSRSERFDQPPGLVIVAILSSLAERRQDLIEVIQHAHGCSFRAAMPSDMFSFKGDVVVEVQAAKNPAGFVTTVDASFTVPGQIYDWGKSRRGLNYLFADLAQLPKCA